LPLSLSQVYDNGTDGQDQSITITLRFRVLQQVETANPTLAEGAIDTTEGFALITDPSFHLSDLASNGSYEYSKFDSAVSAHKILWAAGHQYTTRITNFPILPPAADVTADSASVEYRWDLRDARGNANHGSSSTTTALPGDTITANLLITPYGTDAYGFAGMLVFNSEYLEFVSAELAGQDTGHVLQSAVAGSGASSTLRLWVENDIRSGSSPVPLVRARDTMTITLRFKAKAVTDTISTLSTRIPSSTDRHQFALLTDPSLTYASLYDADVPTLNNNLIGASADGRALCLDQVRDAMIVIMVGNVPRGADVGWYYEDSTATEFHISTAAELYGFRYLVNREENTAHSATFRYQTIFLDADIDLSEVAYRDGAIGVDRRFGEIWKPIGWGASLTLPGADGSGYFMGTFDGQGHTISGLEKNGLFGEIKNAAIKNLKTSGTVVNGGPPSTSTSGSGVVERATDCRLENLKSDVELVYDMVLVGQPIGGIVGMAAGATVVSGCEFNGSFSKTDTDYSGSVTGVGAYGGIVGQVQLSYTGYRTEVEDCVNYANIAGCRNSGGIVGGTEYTDTTNSSYPAALVIRNCVNYGDVVQVVNARGLGGGTFYQGVGGILGSSGMNYELASFKDLGRDLSVSISGCANYGDIRALTSNAGGIVGYVQQGDKLTLTDCYNRGAISVDITRTQPLSGVQSYYGSAGGIAGRIDDDGAYLDRTYSTGAVCLGLAVEGSEEVVTLGGLVGYLTGTPQAGANYYLDSSASSAVAGGTSGIATPQSDDEMREASFAEILGDAFVAEEGDYPVFWWLAKDYAKPQEPVPGTPVLNADGFYELATSEDLIWFANQVNAGNNTINAVLTGTDYSLKSPGFQGIGGVVGGTMIINVVDGKPLGTYTGVYTNSYSGTFDGNGATITLDLFSTTGFIGLFGATDGATLMNFTIEGQVTSYFAAVGGVVGYAVDTTIRNVINNANITNRLGGDPTFGNPNFTTGGLVGYNGGGNEVANSYNTGTVTVTTRSGAGVTAGTTVTTGEEAAFGKNNGFVDVNGGRDSNTTNPRPAPSNGDPDPDDPFKIINTDKGYLLYDSRTHEVIDGTVVVKNPAGPGPGDPNSSGPSVSVTPLTPTNPGLPVTDATPSVAEVTERTTSDRTLPPETVQTPPESQLERPLSEPETPLSDTTRATEVSLTPIPLGLGFQTVANTVLTLVVGFVTLGIFILGGFIFWQMYRRRIGE
jgi:hypothetical protein